MTDNKRSLHVALAGIGTLAATGAQAANVCTDGRDQVLLIYPYYMTRTDSAGNAFLSPFDAWTAAPLTFAGRRSRWVPRKDVGSIPAPSTPVL